MKQASSEEDEFVKEERESAEKYAKSLAQYESALALDKPSGFFKILKVPGIVFFAGIGGYLLGYMELKPWVIIPLLYILGFAFLSRIKEFKKSMEAFVYFSIRKQTVSKYEKVDWMNEVMDKAWKYIESSLSKELLLRVSIMLRKVKLPMVSDVKLDRFTLGGQAPVIEGIRIRKSCKESLIMDVTMHFIPAVAEEIQSSLDTLEEKTISWNSNITIKIRVGSESAGIDIPFTLKNVSFRGSVRIKLNFTYGTSVIKGVEFSFLKQPMIGFNIVPLKIMDIMDIPGLATAIKKVIELGIEKEVLYPKRITISLKPKSMYYVGAIVVRIHRIETNVEAGLFMQIGLNGRKSRNIFEVAQNSLAIQVYLPIKNTDDFISISIHKKRDEGAVSTATMPIQDICMVSRTQEIISLSNSQGYIDASFMYQPKIDLDKKPNEDNPKSAIVTAKLVKLINMVDFLGMPYKNLSVKATVYLRQKRMQSENPADMTAAKLMLEENTSPGFSVTNESSTDSDKELKKNPQHKISNEVLEVFTTAVAKNIANPAFDEKFVFYTRDVKRTVIYIEACDNKKILGSFTVNIRRGISMSYGTFDFRNMPAGRAKLLFSAEYAVMNKVKMKEYTHIRAIKMKNIKLQNVFSGYLVTNGRVVPLTPFFSHCSGEMSGLTYVPLLSPNEVTKYVAYLNGEVFGGCDVLSGESYIRDTCIEMSVVDYLLLGAEDTSQAEALEKKDQVHSAAFQKSEISQKKALDENADTKKVEASPLQNVESLEPKDSKNKVEMADHKTLFIQMRVIVCRVNHPIFLEFSKNNIIIDRSASSFGKKLYGEFYFFTDVIISVFTVKERFLIGKFHLSHSSGRHEIRLTNGQLFVIDVHNRYYMAMPKPLIQKGTLTVTILNMEATGLSDIEIYSSVFVKIVAGKNSTTTTVDTKIKNPIYNEKFKFPLFIPIDMLEIKVYAWTLLKEKKLLGNISLPALSIPPGKSSISTKIFSVSANNSSASIYKINANMFLQ